MSVVSLSERLLGAYERDSYGPVIPSQLSDNLCSCPSSQTYHRCGHNKEHPCESEEPRCALEVVHGCAVLVASVQRMTKERRAVG